MDDIPKTLLTAWGLLHHWPTQWPMPPCCHSSLQSFACYWTSGGTRYLRYEREPQSQWMSKKKMAKRLGKWKLGFGRCKLLCFYAGGLRTSVIDVKAQHWTVALFESNRFLQKREDKSPSEGDANYKESPRNKTRLLGCRQLKLDEMILFFNHPKNKRTKNSKK